MTVYRTARLGRAALLSLMLLTSACASVPFLGVKPEPRAASDFSSSKAFAGPRSEWPGDGWWRRYGDPQLAQLMEQGLADAPDLAAAAARLRAAEGFAQQAGAALKPTVDALAVPELFKQSQNTETPSAAVPNGWNDRGAAGLDESFDREHAGAYSALTPGTTAVTDPGGATVM